MASLSVIIILCVLSGFSTFKLTCAFLDSDDELLATRQKAQYYLEELQRSVARIALLENRLHRSKRDDHRAQMLSKTDFLFSSLLNFCQQIRDFKNISDDVTTKEETSTSSESTTTSNEVTVTEAEEDWWYQPEVFPISVKARREGDKVHLLFHVRHSVPAQVTRIAGFDLEKIDLDKKTDSKTTHALSTVGFTIDNSSYCEEGYELDNQFSFQSKSKPISEVNVRIESCNFDKYQNESIEWDQRTWETRPGPFHQLIPLPKIKIESDINDSIIVTPGENERFDMTTVIESRSYLYMSALYYDRKTKKILDDQCGVYDGQIDCKRSDNRTDQFLRLEMLNKYNISTDEENNEESAINIKRRMTHRVTLITESGRFTGNLYIGISNQHGTYYNPTLVQRVTLHKMISVNRPKRKHVFPRNRIYMQDHRTFLCDKEGNKHYEKIGRNCTLICIAHGRDIQKLTITKKDSSVPIYRHISVKHNSNIYTMVDVGEASPVIEGDYTCTITEAKGYTHTRELQLFTSGFPKINVDQTSVTDFGNGTSQVICTVEGRRPMNISVQVNSALDFHDVRVDNKTTSIRRETENDDGLTLTVHLPTNDLRYPARAAICRVFSELGSQTHYMDLYDVIQNYNLFIPKMKEDESGIHVYSNGTTAITCTASGKLPIDIMMSIGANSEDYRIDKEPGHTKVETMTEDGKRATLYSDTKSLVRPTSWLYCIAKNEYGMDSIDYSLRDFIHWSEWS